MALMNVLNKMNINMSQLVGTPQPTAQPKQAPAVRQAGDTFVKSTQTVQALPRPAAATPSTGINTNQSLGFAEMMSRDPSAIWNTALTPRTEQAIKAYQRGMLGRSVRDMDLRGLTAQQTTRELTKRGFKCEMGVIKDVRTGLPVLNPKTNKEVPMEIWCHADGGMVRVKPEGDPTNRFRPQPHLSVSVKYPPNASGHDFNDEAFKVCFNGNALPKWAKDVKNPFPADTPAGKKFLDDHADRTHINLA